MTILLLQLIITITCIINVVDVVDAVENTIYPVEGMKLLQSPSTITPTKKMTMRTKKVRTLSPTTIKEEDIDQILEKGIHNHIYPGVVALVGDENGILYQKAFGSMVYQNETRTVRNTYYCDYAYHYDFGLSRFG